MQSAETCGRMVWNFRFSREAILKQSRIDLIDGEAILLHLKVVPEREHLVLNSRTERGWGKELRLSVPATMLEQHLDVELRLEDDHLLVVLPNGDQARYDRHLDRLPAAELRLSSGIAPFYPAGEVELHSLQARITRADVMHVAGSIRFSDPRWINAGQMSDARLLLLIDSRPSGSVPLPRPTLSSLNLFSDFAFDLGAGAFVSDGMRAEIVLEAGGQRRVLASSPLSSSFMGALERCTDSIVAGFACNPRVPHRPALVDIFLNGSFQATVPADLPRPDLTELGSEAPQAGFQFRFATPVHLPLSTDAWVSARVHNTDMELAGSPWWICRAVSLDQMLDVADAGSRARPRQG